MTTQLIVRGHSLQREGAAFTDDGTLIAEVAMWGIVTTAGPGRGKCACGTLSDPLPSATARRRWHRTHKLNVLADAAPVRP